MNILKKGLLKKKINSFELTFSYKTIVNMNSMKFSTFSNKNTQIVNTKNILSAYKSEMNNNKNLFLKFNKYSFAQSKLY
jgi:hypothetical protein